VQQRALAMMSGWLGGAFVNRDKKGDPGNRAPIEVTPAKAQREALDFVLRTAFRDESYGLTPELLRRMTVDKWLDDDYSRAFEDPTWPVHERIMGIQATMLTRLMNPGSLGRVYDNEFLTPSSEDMVTLPEILKTIEDEIWSELNDGPKGGDRKHTAREPMISSLRRNLQREFVERLVDLSMPSTWSQASHKPIATLALMRLRDLSNRIDETLKKKGDVLDPYSQAHLTETKLRIEKALDAGYVINTAGGGGLSPIIMIQIGQTNAPVVPVMAR
jgi:hypothetical protein